jgi:hypothetical protein
LIAFYWPDDQGESRIPTGHTHYIENKKRAGVRPTKGAAIAAMQTWLNGRERMRDQDRAADIAAREAETLMVLAADRAAGLIK